MYQKICFVIMGFGKKTDYSSGMTLDLDKTYKNIIKPAAEACEYKCVRSDEIKQSTIIDKSMYGLLLCADLVIADISTYNPNAIYELGVRHAVKPFHTIIIKEQSGDIPFDLNHTSIMSYIHLGEDIGVDESKRCINELKGIIKSIEKSKAIDSPFYEYINSVEPPHMSEDELANIIKELAKENESLFAIVEDAKLLKQKERFAESAILWKKASEEMPSEPYYVQQEALCTYKSKQPSELVALNNASIIIGKLLDKGDKVKNDPETLGIAGAIYKNMYLITNDVAILEQAIKYYGDGFNLRKDYYNGENYALCLNIKASIIKDEEEKIYCNVQANKVRKEIIDILTKIIVSKEIEERDDERWIYATFANCYFALDDSDNGKKYEKKFINLCDQRWEQDTYYQNKKRLFDLL